MPQLRSHANHYERQLKAAANRAGIGHIGTHAMRHTDIRTTLNIYGDVVTDEMLEAHSKVVGLALNGAQTERNSS